MKRKTLLIVTRISGMMIGLAMLMRKVKASLELRAHLTGKIGDHEKYEAHRYDMAKSRPPWQERGPDMRRLPLRDCPQ